MCTSGQQFCLKWNNHTNNMVKVFNQLLDDQNFVDVTLACDGNSIKAHKMVLSACSTYFKDLFVTNPCKHPIVILKDMRFDDLKAIINFMYCGEVNVSQNQLGALLKTAEVLKVKGLTEVNDKQTDSLTVPNNLTTNKVSNETLLTQPTNPSNTSLTRKKRRRRGNHQTNASISGDSEHDSSQSDVSSDETSNKKLKDISAIIDSSSRSSKDSRSLLSESNTTKNSSKIETQTTNIIQTRRRQTLQLQHIESETSREIPNESLVVSDQRVNNGNPSETWPPNAQHNAVALVLPTTETEDESEDMFDVKPIISFDESPIQTSTTIALRDESLAVISSPNEANAIAGPSSAQTGNIRTLRSFGFRQIYTDSRSECPFCTKKIVNLRRHINEVHVGVLFKCHICSKNFKRKDKLNHHLLVDHNV